LVIFRRPHARRRHRPLGRQQIGVEPGSGTYLVRAQDVPQGPAEHSLKNLVENGAPAGEHDPGKKEAHGSGLDPLMLSAAREAAVGHREVRGHRGQQAGESRFRLERKTIRRWRDRWLADGLVGLIPRYPKERAPRSPADVVELIRHAQRELEWKAFQYTALDDCTRYRVRRLYPRQNQWSSLEFFAELWRALPFPICQLHVRQRLRVRVGVSLSVPDAGIRHRYIKPRRPDQKRQAAYCSSFRLWDAHWGLSMDIETRRNLNRSTCRACPS
jgi:hypothetical protein